MIEFHNNEFEWDVREKLNKTDGPVYENDLLGITELDCTNYDFDDKDIEILRRMYNLKSLDICIWNSDLEFLKDLHGLKSLYIMHGNRENRLDFELFSELTGLEELYVSGGDISGIAYDNLNALVGLTELRTLHLHEFGTVDLSPLRQMPGLEDFYCGYAYFVKDIDAVGTLRKLKSLTLIDFEMKNLDFLDNLSDDLSLELCADNIIEGIDWNSFNRFREVDICEMKVNGEGINRTLFRRDK